MSSTKSGANPGARYTLGSAVLGGLSLAFLLIMVVSLFYGSVQTRRDGEYQSIAAEQQLLSQQIAAASLAAASGDAPAIKELQNVVQLYDSTFTRLREGNPTTGLPPVPDTLVPSVENAEAVWQRARTSVDVIIKGAPSVLEAASFVKSINDQVPQLMAVADETVHIMAEKGLDPRIVYIAARQLMLLQRMQTALNQLLSGSVSPSTATDRFVRDATQFNENLTAFLDGSQSLRITRLIDPTVRMWLEDTAEIFSSVNANVNEISTMSPKLFQVVSAAAIINPATTEMLSSGRAFEEAVIENSGRGEVVFTIALVSGVFMVVALFLFGYSLVTTARRRLEESTEQARRNQRAILRLLDELTNLADGDLSAHATVSEDITGAIADSVNYAIDQLRSLVTTINTTAADVMEAASGTSGTAQTLAQASEQQAREIAVASASVTEMATSMERVSKNAAGSADVAMKSVDIAAKGADTVRLSIEGMDAIREQIQQTAKRIKRLGESSQEVGDIIGLINDIADQTNILALNAAIQASTAGEAGRGFAVVADEVQRLAERAGAATKRVEALVKTIQADTNEAVASMEQSTSGVVNGARLAEDAGEALVEIESVSKRLAGLIQNISKEASQQAMSATRIAKSMNKIRQITVQTSKGTSETAGSIGKLADLSVQLKQSVAGFKLPQHVAADGMITTRMMAATTPEEDELLATMMRRDMDEDLVEDSAAEQLVDTFLGSDGKDPQDDDFLDTKRNIAGN